MSRFRIAVAGCGSMADTWVRYALSRDDCEIAALVDLKEENSARMAERHGLDCRLFTDIGRAIEETGANLVFDISIPESHKQVVLSSLALGCHVFGEKPMSTSLAHCRELVEAAKRAGKIYAVMQNRRFDRRIRSLRDIIASGIIGKPGFICADFFLGPHFGGFRELMESPLILDMAIHTFDQARFISGSDPVSVYCHEFNPEGSWYKGNAAAVCIFEMSDGSVFCYRGSWCAEGAPTSWESSWRVTGSKGTAIWDGEGAPCYEIPDGTERKGLLNGYKRVEPGMNWPGRFGHEGCLDEMFAALKEGRKAETDCSDNIKSMAMVFSAIESARTGKKVQVEI